MIRRAELVPPILGVNVQSTAERRIKTRPTQLGCSEMFWYRQDRRAVLKNRAMGALHCL